MSYRCKNTKNITKMERKTVKLTPESFAILSNIKTAFKYRTFSDVIYDLGSNALKAGGKVGKNINESEDLFSLISKYINKQIERPIKMLANQEKLYLKEIIILSDKFEKFLIDFKISESANEVESVTSGIAEKEYLKLKEEKDLFEIDASERLEKIINLESKLTALRQNFKVKKSGVFGGSEVYEAVINPEQFEELFSIK